MKNQPTTPCRRPWIALLAALALATSATAQQSTPPPPPAGSFGETIDVRVVEVEVVVTDARGNLIAGLEPQDFRLRVDGEIVPIHFFSEVREGRLAPAAASGAARLPAAIEAAPGAPRGNAYLVFLDDFFTLPRDRGRVLGRLQRDLAVLAPDDRVALYRYDGKKLSEVLPWTAPGPDLDAGLGRLEAMPALGTWRVLEGRDLESTVAVCNHLDRLKGRTERMVAAAASALRIAPETDRRRSALLLTGGWAYDPARLTTPGACVSQDVLGGAELFRPLTDTANQLGYALYPVDVPGFEGLPAGPDASGNPRGATEDGPGGNPEGETIQGVLGTEQQAVVTLGSDASVVGEAEIDPTAAEWEGHLALRFLAEETGGRALINAASVDALSKVAADGRTYYQLAFQTDRRRDDRRHEVVVEVVYPDSFVRARRSFLDDSRTTAVARASEAALLLDRPAGAAPRAAGPGVPPPLQVALGKPKRSGFRKVALPVAMMIPLDALTVLPDGNGWSAEAEVLFGAIEPDGARSELPAVPIHWRGEHRPAPGSLEPFVTELQLRRGKQDLLVVIHDLRGETILTQRLELDL